MCAASHPEIDQARGNLTTDNRQRRLPPPRRCPFALDTEVDPLQETARTLLRELAQPCADNQTPVTLPQPTDPISRFFSVKPPEIAASTYIDRIICYMECSSSSLICATIYCARLARKDARLAINELNFHRVLTTAVVIAAKFFEDRWFGNSHYARVGGVSSPTALKELELEMLLLIDFHLLVRPEVFQKYACVKPSTSGTATTSCPDRC